MAAEQPSGWLSVAAVWALAVITAVVVVAMAYGGTTSWFGDPSRAGVFAALGVVLAASVLASLGLQLALRRPAGFVLRASASVAGAALVVGLATVAVLPVAFA